LPKLHPIRVGVHELSQGDGPLGALEGGRTRVGATAMQIFQKAKLNYHFHHDFRRKNETFAELRAAADLEVVVHAGYFINLLAQDKRLAKVSAASLINELDGANFLGATTLVLHPGTFHRSERASALVRLADALRFVLLDYDWAPTLCLETMAGGSDWTQFGCFLDDLATVVGTLREEGANLSTCFDTCHAFGAGYDFASSRAAYDAFWAHWDRYFHERPRVLHLNGAAHEFASQKDGHASLAGHFSASMRPLDPPNLNPEVFRWLREDPKFATAAHILETPMALHPDDLALYVAGQLPDPGLYTLSTNV
jgi:deoxyribonuclease-4